MSEITFNDLLKEDGPVALIIKQPLAPVDSENPVIFPPTYPLTKWNGRIHTIQDGEYRVSVELPPDSKSDKSSTKGDQKSGYNIDRFPDGTNICEIDSPQSQSNRIEPKFKTIEKGKLVPQVEIQVGKEKVNLLDVGHRAGDAVVRMSSIAAKIHEAFIAAKSHDFFKLATIAPTSLVFGVWDSRSTYVKVQRVLKAQIRATNVLELSRSAQFTPATNYVDAEAIGDDVEFGKGEESNLSQEGMLHALSTQAVGGVRLTNKSCLVRTVNLNLAAIRTLKGSTEEETKVLQKYILGLALVAATDEPDLNLREGCHLVFSLDKISNDEEVKMNEASQLVYRSKMPINWSCNHEMALVFTDEAKKEFLKVAKINEEQWNHPDIIFERDVAENFLSRKKEERDKIRKLGPITKETLAKFDAQGKDPFKLVNEEIKKIKGAIGKKPGRGKPPLKQVEAFHEIAELLKLMAVDETMPASVNEIAQELQEIAGNHEDSHAAIKEIDECIKKYKREVKSNSDSASDTEGSSEASQ
ncbi:MAG: type I-U CRISPR-associated RAMP protein Csb1/Cas7u [Candidatus Omnitrophota bacterium]